MTKIACKTLKPYKDLFHLNIDKQTRIIGGDVAASDDGQILIIQFIDLNGLNNTVINVARG